MAKPRGLGRGLKSLLGDDLTLAVMPDKSNGITEIELSKLQAGKYQPRTAMEQEKLQELADSIREQGVISPIIIARLPPTSTKSLPVSGVSVHPSLPERSPFRQLSATLMTRRHWRLH